MNASCPMARSPALGARALFLTALALAGLPLPLKGYELLGVHWVSGSASYRVNPNFPEDPGGSRELQIELLRCGADAWREQTRADFRFVFLGTSTRRGFQLEDNVNNVSWLDSDGGEALAATVIDGVGATATDFDMVFFARTSGTGNRWSGGQDPPSGTFDIQGVAVHEFGHALGLGHTEVLDATMFAGARNRGLTLRTLHADDIAGVESIYGLRDGFDLGTDLLAAEPASGPLGGGNRVVLLGRNFTWTADTTLLVGGRVVSRSLYNVLDCQRIEIPSMVAGTVEGPVDLRVVDELGSSTLAGGYRYGAAGPRLVAIEPAAGPTSGGIGVSISGENFTASARVAIGGNVVTDAVVVDSRTIRGTLPAASPGTVSVILDQGADHVTLPDAFTYVPNVLRVQDTNGPAGVRRLPVRVLATCDTALSGVSFAVVYDEAQVTFDAVTVDGTAADGAEFAAANIDNAGGVTTFGLVMSFTETVPNIPAGANRHVASILASLNASLIEGTAVALVLQSGAGSPPIELQFTPVGSSGVIRPLGLSGVIAVSRGPLFVRGDVDVTGGIDLSDPIALLNYLFRGAERLACFDAADATDDGGLDISDAVYDLIFLFRGGNAPPPPFPAPGVDPTADELDCERGVESM